MKANHTGTIEIRSSYRKDPPKQRSEKLARRGRYWCCVDRSHSFDASNGYEASSTRALSGSFVFRLLIDTVKDLDHAH